MQPTQIISINIEEQYPAISASYENVLSEKELNKAERYVQDSDRKSYLVRKYYLRMVLGNLLSINPAGLEFNLRGNKRPTVSGLEFNTSHSGNYAVIGVGPAAIGLDIEEINPDFNFKPIVDSCFSAEEQRFVAFGNQVCNFYHVWTRKEAILKASAEGLTDGLQLLNCVPGKVLRKGVSYDLTTCVLTPGYMLSIASQQGAGKLQYWQIGGNFYLKPLAI